MRFVKIIINRFLKIFNLKLVKIVDQFDNSYRLNLAFKENKIDYVLDVGANEGQFIQNLRYYGYKYDVLSFEPSLKAHKKLLENLAFNYLPNGLINNIKEGSSVKTDTIANNIAKPVKIPK